MDFMYNTVYVGYKATNKIFADFGLISDISLIAKFAGLIADVDCKNYICLSLFTFTEILYCSGIYKFSFIGLFAFKNMKNYTRCIGIIKVCCNYI